MTSNDQTGESIKSWLHSQAPQELSLPHFQSYFPVEYRYSIETKELYTSARTDFMTLHREHAQVKDLWMDYRAHHSHVVKVVDNELQEEINEREIIRNDVCQ